MDNHQIIEEGRRVFNTEITALQKTRDALNETFATIIQEFSKCKGKIIVTGMGKPGHIATKIAASLSSLGTPSFCLHPAEAMHGDLGMVTSQDVVFAISYSGESDEIVRILPYFKLIGAKVIALTGNPDSTLAKAADISEVFPKFDEACALGLAPTSSTTAELCYGDALAVVCSIMAGFRDENYARIHPAGSLGKKLIYKVSDIMVAGEDNAVVQEGTSMKDTIIEISKKGLGMVSVVDAAQHLRGIVTNGDLRRQLDEGVDIYALRVEDVMTKRPIVINSEQLAVEALNLMKERMINSLPVIDRQDRLIGTIRWQDILHAGIVTM
jgi:arabinose-5-phosphate isomerase